MRGLYIHWPYCRAICPYCDFNVYRSRENDTDLLSSVLGDVRGWSERMAAGPVHSVYLGGGTPSLLEAADIDAILSVCAQTFGVAEGAEITLEVNPEDASPEKLADFVAAGVDRFSVGAQALDDAALQALGRWHSARDTIRAIGFAAKTGARVSADFIYARSGQTLKAWQDELAQITALPVEHLSLYQLTIEPGTAFEKKAGRGELDLPDGDASADFFEETRRIAAEAGFHPYEVSNFARTARAQSRHNLIYWLGGEWAGIGPGASGRFLNAQGQRIATTAFRRPKDFAAGVQEHGWGVEVAEPLQPQDDTAERIMMGLRLEEGIALTTLPLSAQELVRHGYLHWNGASLKVAERHRALTDAIARQWLMRCEENDDPVSFAPISPKTA